MARYTSRHDHAEYLRKSAQAEKPRTSAGRRIIGASTVLVAVVMAGATANAVAPEEKVGAGIAAGEGRVARVGRPVGSVSIPESVRTKSGAVVSIQTPGQATTGLRLGNQITAYSYDAIPMDPLTNLQCGSVRVEGQNAAGQPVSGAAKHTITNAGRQLAFAFHGEGTTADTGSVAALPATPPRTRPGDAAYVITQQKQPDGSYRPIIQPAVALGVTDSPDWPAFALQESGASQLGKPDAGTEDKLTYEGAVVFDERGFLIGLVRGAAHMPSEHASAATGTRIQGADSVDVLSAQMITQAVMHETFDSLRPGSLSMLPVCSSHK